MPFNVIFYIIAAILTVNIVVRVVIRKAKPNLGDLLTAVGIVISSCIVNQPAPAIDQSQWLIRKDYTINGTLLEANPGEGWSSNPLESNIKIKRSFRLYVEFLEAKGTNAIMLSVRISFLIEKLNDQAKAFSLPQHREELFSQSMTYI